MNNIEDQIPNKTNRKCPSCGTGNLMLREGKYGLFVGCTRFPECTYTTKKMPKNEEDEEVKYTFYQGKLIK